MSEELRNAVKDKIAQRSIGLRRIEPHKLGGYCRQPADSVGSPPTPATDERLVYAWYGRLGDGPWVRLTEVFLACEKPLEAKDVDLGTIGAKVI